MSNEDRAKQFMPFSPLSGLGVALIRKEKEKIFVKRKTPSDDKIETLNRILGEIKTGDRACVVHYNKGEYKRACGEITKIDEKNKILKIEDQEIHFLDIWEIKTEL